MTIAGRKRTVLRRAARLGALTVALGMVAVLFWLKGALYNRVIRYPKEAAALAVIRADRRPVIESSGWPEYRGLLHSHSSLSHDSEVPFEEILRVLHVTGRDFIALSDHCIDARADVNSQWRGVREGKLFIPGFEMRGGLMPFGVAPGVILSNTTASALLAKQIVEHGGVLFYAHPEEPRDWDLPELAGMEIYNIHAEFKQAGGLRTLLPELLVNQRRYPEEVLRRMLRRPTANLQRWDQCNRTRHLTGIAGNDCHQNTGVRGFYTTNNTVLIEDTSPKKLAEFKLNALTRFLARLCFGPLLPNAKLFHLELDPYERMTRFVTTHVLARELSEAAILDALRAGRVFIGFDMLADSTGFAWLAQNGSERAVMGQSLTFSPETQLRAAAPHACRFVVVNDGIAVHQEEGRTLEWKPPRPGVYRVEAELKVAGRWTPWVYANPIWLR